MAGEVLLNDLPDVIAELDDLPNNQQVSWPLSCDGKLAIGATLNSVLEALGFTGMKKIPVIMMGSFHKQMLVVFDKGKEDKDDQKLWKVRFFRPVIVVSRATDRGRRIGTGEILGEFPASAMIDTVGALDGKPEALVYGQLTEQTIDVIIFDTNPRRIERLFSIVKLLMIQIQNELLKICGFFEVSRVDGGDGQDITTDNPIGVSIVYQRTLTYRVVYPEAITLIPQLVELAQIAFHADPSIDPSGGAEIVINA